MGKLDASRTETPQPRSDKVLHGFAHNLSGVRDRQQLTSRIVWIFILGYGIIPLAGCQPGPPLPLGFGPTLDNLFGILILFVIGFVLYRLLAPRFGGGRRGNFVGPAELIAQERYARGEITEAEYHQILRTLAAR